MVDLIAYDDPSIIHMLDMDELRAGDGWQPPRTSLRRYRIALRQCGDARQAANVHHNLGVVLQQLGQHAQAVRSFRDSLGAGGDARAPLR